MEFPKIKRLIESFSSETANLPIKVTKITLPHSFANFPSEFGKQTLYDKTFTSSESPAKRLLKWVGTNWLLSQGACSDSLLFSQRHVGTSHCAWIETKGIRVRDKTQITEKRALKFGLLCGQSMIMESETVMRQTIETSVSVLSDELGVVCGDICVKDIVCPLMWGKVTYLMWLPFAFNTLSEDAPPGLCITEFFQGYLFEVDCINGNGPREWELPPEFYNTMIDSTLLMPVNQDDLE